MTKSRNLIAKRWHWTEADDRLLRERYADTAAWRLAGAIGCNERQVYIRARKLGLHKAEAFAGSINDGRRRSPGTEFRPGQKPWNAGIKGLQLSGGKGLFKPGHQPHNAVPVGTLRVTTQGILRIKLGETGRHNLDWVPYARYVWLEAFPGPLPRDARITWRAGGRMPTDPQQITADRLECVSMAEMSRRNGVASMPPELRRLHQLRGALTAAINRRDRQEGRARNDSHGAAKA